MAYLSQCVQRLNHKTSKVRDVGDEIAKSVLDFAERDTNDSKAYNNINHTLNPQKSVLDQFFTNLSQYSAHLSLIEDHRDSMVKNYIKYTIIKQFFISIYNLYSDREIQYENSERAVSLQSILEICQRRAENNRKPAR